MKTIGIDIGTSSISIVLVEENKIIEEMTFPNKFLLSKYAYEQIQEAKTIAFLILNELENIFSKYNEIEAIGVTGQMHGIVYVGKGNKLYSPLYTWCDKRSNEQLDKDYSYLDYIKMKTNYDIAVGYGLGTHFYNVRNNLIKKKEYKILSIHGYIANLLGGVNYKDFVIHASDAAGFGFYKIEENKFDIDALKTLGINQENLPKVVFGNEVIGKYKTANVYVALGDNQASYLGASSGQDVLLINIGTGAQVSMRTSKYYQVEGIETRPYLNNDYLLVGASINGGIAYTKLAELFQEISGLELDEVYKKMETSKFDEDDELLFLPNFLGSREDKNKKGSLINITLKNFRKDNLVVAMLKGISSELYEYYKKIALKIDSEYIYVASGNGIRKNKLFQKIITNIFGNKIILSEIKEEAAYGACLFTKIK